jgi:mono/diheme cytochrome c family protein
MERTMKNGQISKSFRRARMRDVMVVGGIVAAVVLSACGGSTSKTVPETSDPAAIHGRQLTTESCAACHGTDFDGIDDVGPSFFDNAYIQDESDTGLITFIKEGRPNNHPDNKTGVAMPMYGGNPQLTDGDLADIVAFLRTLQ